MQFTVPQDQLYRIVYAYHHDPSEVLGPIARTGPEWHRETFESFVQRTDITLAAFGWSIVDSALCRSWRSSGGLGRAHRKD